MTNTDSTLFRSLLIYGICLPLAMLVGYILATGNFYDLKTLWPAGLVLFVLLLPLLLRWHHAWLIASWNMSMVLFFLYGQPSAFLLMSIVSLMISLGQYILDRKMKFLRAPSVTKSLIFIVAVVLVMGQLTGGFGLKMLGSENFGGKRYFEILCAIFGYFAITSHRIPPHRAGLYVALFFLGQLTQSIGELAQWVNPAFYFLFRIFPLSAQGVQSVLNNPGTSTDHISRFTGLAFSCAGVYFAMMACYGIREVFNVKKPWRVAVFLAVVGISTLGGYRSVLILFILTFAFLFCLEGLMRGRFLIGTILALILGGTILVTVTDRLPTNVQRTLSFLPLPVDPVVRVNAEGSTDWRVNMWKNVVPQIPRYLIIGKGYGIKASELNAISMSTPIYSEMSSAGAELAGDYHNGPLSVIMPFGIFGSIGFIWFLWAGARVLHKNYRYGDPAFHRYNTFLLAYFIARIIFFSAVFGSLHSDLAIFTGMIGLSVSLNGGVARPEAAPQPEIVKSRFAPSPASRKPIAAD